MSTTSSKRSKKALITLGVALATPFYLGNTSAALRKQLRSVLLASTALIMLAIPPSWAAPPDNPPGQGNTHPGQGGTPPGQAKKEAPEIDVGAGGAGLTVLAIALLLASERRSRAS